MREGVGRKVTPDARDVRVAAADRIEKTPQVLNRTIGGRGDRVNCYNEVVKSRYEID
jgi:hypothetical protein